MDFVEIFRGTEEEIKQEVKKRNAIARGQKSCGTRYYRCRFRRDEPDCKYSLRSEPDGAAFVLYEKGNHTHNGSPTSPQHGITPEARKRVKLYSTSGCSLTQIRRALAGEGFDIPDKTQLKNFAAYDRRTASNLPANIDAFDVCNWCLSHSYLPSNPHHMFVLPGYRCVSPDDCFIFFTTRYLLEMATKRPLLQVDCTYKVLLNDCPIMIAGTSDLDRHFHPFGIAIVDSDEKTETYLQFFRAIIHGINLIDPNFEFCPKYIMGDGCAGITAAAKMLFPDSLRLMCWTHVISNVKKHKGKGFPPELWKSFKEDLRCLQLSQFDGQFQTGADLLTAKWGFTDSEIVTKFFDYFKKQYFHQLSFWYEGAADMYPSTNNGVESYNALLKKVHTQYRRQSFSNFLVECSKLIPEWSTNSACTGFSTKPAIGKSLGLAKEWLQNKNASDVQQLGTNMFVVGSSNQTMTIDEWFKLFYSYDFENFDNFKSFVQSFYYIYESPNGMLRCSCWSSLKHYVCKHIHAVKVLFCGFTIPSSMNAKRKPGRPPKMGGALSLV